MSTREGVFKKTPLQEKACLLEKARLLEKTRLLKKELPTKTFARVLIKIIQWF